MAWIPLRLSTSAGAHLPPLLISASFTRSSYHVQLTDVTHIWSEKLDRRAIVQRSREENTSIDPSDSGQLHIFLDKLKLGLAGGKETRLALTIAHEADRPSLILNVSVKLPGGLAPLEWPVQLAAMPQSLLTSQLTVPLLIGQHTRMKELASLAEVIREKDHVIQKLMDKLDSQGTELGQIFPQAAGKAGRTLDRKRAEERVKGLGSFDMEAWRKTQNHETSQDIAGLIRDLFTGDESPLEICENVTSSEETNGWWESIKGITVDLESGKISTNGLTSLKKSNSPPKSKPSLRKEDTIDDDAFQVQATPPQLCSPPKRAASKPVVVNDSTDDDDGLDAHSQRSKIPDSFPPSQPAPVPEPPKAKKLGAIAGKKAAQKINPPDEDTTDGEPSTPKKAPSHDKTTASSVASPAPVKTQSKLGRIGGKKEAPSPEPEPELEGVSSPPAKASPAPEAPKQKKVKLGQIGGRKKGAETPPPAEDALEPKTSTTPKPKKKLGAIGGHRHQSPAAKMEDSPAKMDETESRGRPSVRVFEREKTPPPRETSEERADQKRLQLKRELEEKAKAPVKKKRKF